MMIPRPADMCRQIHNNSFLNWIVLDKKCVESTYCRDIIYVLNLPWHLYALDIISSAESFKINTTLIQLDNVLDKYNKSTFWRLTINDCNKFSERIKSGGWSHQNKTPPSDLQCSGCARRANWKIHDTSFWPDMQAMFDDASQYLC